MPPRDEQEIMKIKQIKDPAMIIASHDFHLQFQWNFFLMKTHKCLIIYWFQFPKMIQFISNRKS